MDSMIHNISIKGCWAGGNATGGAKPQEVELNKLQLDSYFRESS